MRVCVCVCVCVCVRARVDVITRTIIPRYDFANSEAFLSAALSALDLFLGGIHPRDHETEQQS